MARLDKGWMVEPAARPSRMPRTTAGKADTSVPSSHTYGAASPQRRPSHTSRAGRLRRVAEEAPDEARAAPWPTGRRIRKSWRTCRQRDCTAPSVASRSKTGPSSRSAPLDKGRPTRRSMPLGWEAEVIGPPCNARRSVHTRRRRGRTGPRASCKGKSGPSTHASPPGSRPPTDRRTSAAAAAREAGVVDSPCRGRR